MSLNRGYQQYKEQSIMTMTSGEMLLLLYDEMLKRLTRAELAVDQQDYDTFAASVQRCKEIIQYLKSTLNFEYSISSDLRRMYDFFFYELSRAEASRKKETLEELRPLVKELRDAFAEAGKAVND